MSEMVKVTIRLPKPLVTLAKLHALALGEDLQDLIARELQMALRANEGRLALLGMKKIKPRDKKEEQVMAFDQSVRKQIEEVMVYLVAEGLADVEYPPVLQVKAFDTNLHTIRATFKGKDRFLKLDHDWLSDHPNDAVALLQEKEIAKSLKAGDFALTIQAKGTIKRNL